MLAFIWPAPQHLDEVGKFAQMLPDHRARLVELRG
jgi:hypothetical protein